MRSCWVHQQFEGDIAAVLTLAVIHWTGLLEAPRCPLNVVLPSNPPSGWNVSAHCSLPFSDPVPSGICPDCASSSLGEHFPLCPSQGLMASLEQNLSMLLVFPCPRAERGHPAKQRIHPWLVSRSWVSSFAVCAQVMLPSSLHGSDNVPQTLSCSGGFGRESSLWNQSCVVLKSLNKWRCRTKLPSDCCVKWE